MSRRRPRGEWGVAQDGFSLIELLVVMVIIGLLAAIAFPSFFAQRDKAYDARAKASARTAATAIETFATDHQGEYTGATAADLVAIESTLGGAALAIDSAGADAYSLTVSSGTGNTFTVERHGDGTSDYACAAPGRGGCPDTGRWR